MDNVKLVYLQQLKNIDNQTSYFTNTNRIHTHDTDIKVLQNDLLEYTVHTLTEQTNLLDDVSKAIINLLFFEYHTNFEKTKQDDFDYDLFAKKNNLDIEKVKKLKECTIPIYHEIRKLKINDQFDYNKENYLDILPKVCEFLKK